MAARTRSRASWTAVSGSPTTWKAGSPGEMSTSTSTTYPSSPTTAQVSVLARIFRLRERTQGRRIIQTERSEAYCVFGEPLSPIATAIRRPGFPPHGLLESQPATCGGPAGRRLRLRDLAPGEAWRVAQPRLQRRLGPHRIWQRAEGLGSRTRELGASIGACASLSHRIGPLT